MLSREKLKAARRKEIRAAIAGQASLRDLRMSSRKAKYVADIVRGKSVDEALTTLAFQRKKAAGPLRQVISSALANAQERGSDAEKLTIASIQVDGGAISKRFMPRAQGRAGKIRKRTSHITVVLKEIGV